MVVVHAVLTTQTALAKAPFNIILMVIRDLTSISLLCGWTQIKSRASLFGEILLTDGFDAVGAVKVEILAVLSSSAERFRSALSRADSSQLFLKLES